MLRQIILNLSSKCFFYENNWSILRFRRICQKTLRGDRDIVTMNGIVTNFRRKFEPHSQAYIPIISTYRPLTCLKNGLNMHASVYTITVSLMAFRLQLQFNIKNDNQSLNFGFVLMHNKNSKVKLMPNSHTEAESKRKLDIFFISIDRSSCRDSEIALDSIVSEGTLRGSRNNLIVNNATDCVLNSKF